MLLGTQKTTDDLIIELLADGSQTGKAVFNHVHNTKSISKQSVYERLRNLINQDIILKIKTKYFLNNEWVDKIDNLFTNYNAPSLVVGESISYSFNSLSALNTHWKHLFYSYNSINPDIPAFSYDKHPFWEHLSNHQENEEKYFRLFKRDRQSVFFLIGSEYAMDLEFKKRNQGEFYKINCVEVNKFNTRDFIMVFGDIVMTSRVPQEFIDQISELYRKELSLETLRIEVRELVEQVTHATLKIEHNAKKARKFQKTILKDFLITLELKKKLNI